MIWRLPRSTLGTMRCIVLDKFCFGIESVTKAKVVQITKTGPRCILTRAEVDRHGIESG